MKNLSWVESFRMADALKEFNAPKHAEIAPSDLRRSPFFATKAGYSNLEF